MPEWLVSVLKVFKDGGLPYFLGVGIAASVFLALPDDTFAPLGDTVWLRAAALAFSVFCWSMVLAIVGLKVLDMTGAWFKRKAKLAMLQRKILGSSIDERTVVIWCIENHTNHLWLPKFSRPAATLKDKGLLMSIDIGKEESWPYLIPQHVWYPIQEISGPIRASVQEGDTDFREMWEHLDKCRRERPRRW